MLCGDCDFFELVKDVKNRDVVHCTNKDCPALDPHADDDFCPFSKARNS